MLWEKPQREPVPRSLRTELLLRCKGKCEKCGLTFYEEGVRPHFHHKDGDPNNNKPSNIIVVCPNCHSKLHKWKVVEEENIFGFVVKKRKLVAVKPKKSKKTKKSKKIKRRKKRETESPWESLFQGRYSIFPR
ncbi:MAG: HNH endonuclease signature motif containing protein [Candidatus Bathyarchaeia archaeon]